MIDNSFIMYFEKFITERYKTYSIYEKIDLLLALHKIFNLMLGSMEKIRKIRELDVLEEDALNLELLNLKNDIWKSENEINKIRKQITNKDILKKIENEQIDRISHEIVNQEQTHDNLVQSLKRLLLQISLYCLQIKDLNNRKSTPSICEKEQYILPEIIEVLRHKILDNYREIEYQERWVIPVDFRYRREIIDSIEDSEIEASKVIPPEMCVTVDYLKDEKNGNIDLRKWDTIKWLMKRYDMFRSPKYPFLDSEYKFNFQALLNGFNRYSYKKQIEVGLAYCNSYKIQLEALMKWRKIRLEKLTEYEELIYNCKVTKYQAYLDIWDHKILQVFFIDIIERHFYPPEMIKKIKDKIYSANLRVNSYYIEVDEKLALKRKKRTKEKYNELVANYKSLKDEYQRKCKLLSFSFDPRHMSGDRFCIPASDLYDPNREEYIKFLITVHNIQTVECNALLKSIGELKGDEKKYEKIIIESLCVYKTHHVLLTDDKIWKFFNMLPNDYPDRKGILKKIKKAKVCLDLEEKEEKPGRELYNYSAYPGSKELFANDEPPKLT